MGLKKETTCINCHAKFKPYSSSKGKYCSRKCQQSFQYEDYIKKWINGDKKGGTEDNISHRVIKYLFDKANNCCMKCKWKTINSYTNKCPLQINHIDGDAKNNNHLNLELLCPNCHALTKNFGNIGNRKSSRINRKKRYSSYITSTSKNKISI